MDPDSSFISASLAYAYGAASKRNEAQTILGELKERAKHKHVDPSHIAIVHLGLGERDQAFVWLEKAYEVRSEEVLVLNVEPRFDSLRGDPRFTDLVKRMKLEP